MLLSSRKVLVLVLQDQFTCLCPCLRTSSPCSQITNPCRQVYGWNKIIKSSFRFANMIDFWISWPDLSTHCVLRIATADIHSISVCSSSYLLLCFTNCPTYIGLDNIFDNTTGVKWRKNLHNEGNVEPLILLGTAAEAAAAVQAAGGDVKFDFSCTESAANFVASSRSWKHFISTWPTAEPWTLP